MDSAAHTQAEPHAQALEIAVGVLVDRQGRLLIAQRRAGTPGAGRWEFPGGKQEPGESMFDCLARELDEEIGVRGLRAEPVIRFSHAHGDRPVRLHVWRIDEWSGQAQGREGQRLEWVEREALADYQLLPATGAILHALFLPDRYVITPSMAAAGEQAWWPALEATLADGAPLLRLRDHALDDAAYQALAARVLACAHAHGARLLIDRDSDMCEALGADGVHWPVARLLAKGKRPLAAHRLLAVSAHSYSDLKAATRLGADFAVLSPVAPTPTHPGASPLGWDGWNEARAEHALPVYALGGLGGEDIATARAHNAQGVAAIRAFWRG
ncbi:Nudix family hydrolase [Salinisphaera aquimarina]|uniref:8-oxo-dGTP diphosphatase n=1 Tax=Salinisphaera aquimarina TaxID=2094031 RepID=A0ABV7EIA5_9GAMM